MNQREIPVVIAATLFGVLIWLSVGLRDDYTVTVAAPLVISDIEQGWAVKTPVPHTLQLRFRGQGWRLAFLLLGPKITLNYSYASLNPGRPSISYNDVADRVSSRPGIQLIDVSPDSVILEIEHASNKRIPIHLDTKLSFKDGYGLVDTISVKPDSVIISGAESIIRRIDAWPTVPQTFSDLKTPLETDVPLATSATYDLSFSVTSVRVRLDVDAFAEKILTALPVEVVSVPPNREVILIPPKVEVVIRGGIKHLSTVANSDLRAWVDYAQILSDTTGAVDINIVSPTWVQVVRKRPERLQYITRKRL